MSAAGNRTPRAANGASLAGAFADIAGARMSVCRYSNCIYIAVQQDFSNDQLHLLSDATSGGFRSGGVSNWPTLVSDWASSISDWRTDVVSNAGSRVSDWALCVFGFKMFLMDL